MLGDYLRSFWRGVLHNKVATLINVGGLAMGLAVFFALSFYVNREFSWDEHWEDADRLYIVAGALESATGTTSSIISTAPYVLGDTLLARNPDAFEAYARVDQHAGLAVIDDTEFPFTIRYHAEPALLDLLQFETLAGSLDEVFTDPRAIALNQSTAQRFFGDAAPLGKLLTFRTPPGTSSAGDVPPVDFVVKAVFTLREPTIFSISSLALLDPNSPPQQNERSNLWQAVPPQPGEPQSGPTYPLSVSHYFKLRDGVDADALAADLRRVMDENRYMDTGISKTRHTFRKVTDQHLYPTVLDVADNVQRLWVYAAIGVLVLMISGANFVMLATLRLVDRMREVGIRKSVGGGTGQLMRQYLLDAFFQTLIAAALAVLFLAFAFPKLQVMLQLPLQLDVVTPRNLALSLLAVVLFTFISSLYPAWISSRTRPGPLLRNGAVVGTGTGLRKLLVGMQFAIVVVLLLASAVVRQQIAYTKNRDPGYSLEHVITALGAGQIQAVVTEFMKVPGVEGAAVSGIGPGSLTFGPPTLVKTFAADGSSREAGLQQVQVGADYFRVMSVRVLAGREFSDALDVWQPPTAQPAGPRNVLLNESAVRVLGFASADAALQQLLEIESTTADRQVRKQSLRVVGVVGDTQFSSVMVPPVPQFYNHSPLGPYLAVKVVPTVDKAIVIEELGSVWDAVLNGSRPFTPNDINVLSAFQLRREEFEANVITGSTLLAIVIALLGLYGLVAATVVKRVKEIGVRKVMGAERMSIITLFLWQFSKPIAAANLIAWPVGFWAITRWLQRFPYQLDLSVIVFTGFAASFAALLIAWLTVGVMAARAASVKPVLALRYE